MIKTAWTHRIEEEYLEELPAKKFESISCHCLQLFSIMAAALFYQCEKALRDVPRVLENEIKHGPAPSRFIKIPLQSPAR